MAKSKKERRSSIRHMPAEGDVLAIFDALERAEKEEQLATTQASGDDAGDLDEDHRQHAAP